MKKKSTHLFEYVINELTFFLRNILFYFTITFPPIFIGFPFAPV